MCGESIARMLKPISKGRWKRRGKWQLLELAIQPDQVHLCVRTLPSPLPIARYIQHQSEHEEVPASTPALDKERPFIPVLERTGLSGPSYVNRS